MCSLHHLSAHHFRPDRIISLAAVPLSAMNVALRAIRPSQNPFVHRTCFPVPGADTLGQAQSQYYLVPTLQPYPNQSEPVPNARPPYAVPPLNCIFQPCQDIVQQVNPSALMLRTFYLPHDTKRPFQVVPHNCAHQSSVLCRNPALLLCNFSVWSGHRHGKKAPADSQVPCLLW